MPTDNLFLPLRRTPLADASRGVNKHYAQQQVDNLIAAGLLGPGAQANDRSRTNNNKAEYRPKGDSKFSNPKTEHHLFRKSNRDREPSSSGQHRRNNTDNWPPAPRGGSSLAELRERRNSMMAAKGRESRRERTFIGSSCAACEEPLEHTLRGERILQLSCGHVSHEACFYEYIKEFEAQSCPTCNQPLGLDTSRGGGIDFDNLNRLVRQAQTQTPDIKEQQRDTQATPTPWDHDAIHDRQPTSPMSHRQRSQSRRDHLLPNNVRNSEQRYPGYASTHTRNASGDTGVVSTNDYADQHHGTGRRHDYDVQSMETSLMSPRTTAKNPIPAPLVTVRSEFPTLSKSKQQQSLTCLITVEVVDGNWHPNQDDIRSPPPVPSSASDAQYEQPKVHRPQTSRQPVDSVHEGQEVEELEEAREELFKKVENWHGLDFQRFGKLILHGTVRVGKDRQSWQELECYLFSEMLICVKEKKTQNAASQQWDGSIASKTKSRCTLKGSILIKKHLKQVDYLPEMETLTLSLSVLELPHFHLQFRDHSTLETWRKALANINRPLPPPIKHSAPWEQDTSGTDEEDCDNTTTTTRRRLSSLHSSSHGGNRSQVTAPTEYTNHSRGTAHGMRLTNSSIHVPLDIVVVIPVSSSMQGLKINLLKDTLRFLVSSLGERDRMGLVTFGSAGGGVPLVSMTGKNWKGWSKVLESIRPTGQKNMRADVVEGANVAMDLLMQRRSANPLSSILLISDSATSDAESVDFVVSRAEAAKIGIHSFGLGLTHKPDTMVELSSRTKACYTYVKDWMMLRECVAGCLGALQSTSHQNVKLKLRLPEGSPAKFVKISGAIQITKRATGRDAEASLGDLRFGDKRDVLVQLAIAPDNASPDHVPTDPWENIISGLEALGGPLDQDEMPTVSVEEVPLIQADLSWGDILREGAHAQLPRPSLLAITMLPASKKGARPASPPIPPHPSVVQRRMELLTSDMLSRALTLVSRGQHDRANHLLAETRSILKGLGKGGLPPLPPPPSGAPPNSALPPTPTPGTPRNRSPAASTHSSGTNRNNSPPRQENRSPFNPAAGIDTETMTALDKELGGSLEWISHPAVFSRDARKAVLQAINVISSQRAYTFRSQAESLWAARIPGIKRLSEKSLEWREAGDESLMEEA